VTRASVRAPGGALRVVFDGDSIANYPTTPTAGTRRMPRENFPHKVMTGLGVPAANICIDGQSWDAATTGGLLGPQLNRATTTGLFMVGGHNEVEMLATAADVYAEWVAYADAARAAGADWIVAGTCLPAFNFDGTEETLRVNSNALLVADADLAFDAVVDLAAVSGLDNFLSANYLDAVHLSDAGTTLAANTFRADPTVATLLGV
jgi:hypothetical protein